MARDDWREWFRSWAHDGRLAHPDSPKGGSGTGHARRAIGVHQSLASAIPHPDSPAGKRFPWSDLLLDVGLRMPGFGKSIFLWVASKYKKVGQPFSMALLQHYVEGTGDPYDLSEIGPIPEEWRVWIVKETNAKVGRHHLNPYNAKPFIPDLKNSLGHFDVVVSAKGVSGLRIYQIEKNSYHFGFKPNDRHRKGQHGFELPGVSQSDLQDIEYVLPSRRYQNPGGFSEGFEIKRVNGKSILYVPQKIAAQAGRPFKVTGRFEH